MSGEQWRCFAGCRFFSVKVFSTFNWRHATCSLFTAEDKHKPVSVIPCCFKNQMETIFLFVTYFSKRILCFYLSLNWQSFCLIVSREIFKVIMNDHPKIGYSVWQRQSIIAFRCINIKQQISIFLYSNFQCVTVASLWSSVNLISLTTNWLLL